MATRVTGKELERMRSWDRDHEAAELDERAREIESESKETFVEIGLLVVEMEDRELYRNLVNPETQMPLYESLGQWIHDAMPTQHSTAYAARAAIRNLRGIVPEPELREMPRCNIETLGKCSSDVARDPLIRTKAKTDTQNEFVRTITGIYPTQHLEERDKYRLAPTKSQSEVYEAAIEAVRLLMGDQSMSREESLEYALRAFLDDREEMLKGKIQHYKQVSAAIQ